MRICHKFAQIVTNRHETVDISPVNTVNNVLFFVNTSDFTLTLFGEFLGRLRDQEFRLQIFIDVQWSKQFGLKVISVLYITDDSQTFFAVFFKANMTTPLV